MQNVVCEICGDIGFRPLLLCCRDCHCSATHQYCLENVIYDASLIEWLCYECLQRRGEVTRIRSIEKVPCERPLVSNHAQFGSIIHQPIAKRVESEIDAGPWRNSESQSSMKKYASLKKIYSSQNKSNMLPMGNCTNIEGLVTEITAHTSAKASYSCEIIKTEAAKSDSGKNLLADHENPDTFNIKQPSPLIMNCLGTSGDTDQCHLLEAMEELACKSKKTLTPLTESFQGIVTNRENLILGSTTEHRNAVLEQSGGKSDRMNNSGANHDNRIIEHSSVGCKNMKVKSSSAKENKIVVGADKNKYRAAGSLRNNMDKFEVHGDSNNNIIDSLMPEGEKEEIRLQSDYSVGYELPPRNMAATVPQLSTLENDVVDKIKPHSPNDGCEEVLPCHGIKNTPTVQERSADSIVISSISQHGTTEASASSERLTECQKGYNIVHVICIFFLELYTPYC
ncbi:hypothetical protein HU200_048645 [Digitaria exilis]|uniref:Zinc finger PHD-type domain-containing protein n=1 Tax=Digitaria exilis TaxID=1010633 RepID=A0A835B0G9_9POAL|nr:hypothetical protein HU200_048645 [Digitaria exilis]